MCEQRENLKIAAIQTVKNTIEVMYNFNVLLHEAPLVPSIPNSSLRRKAPASSIGPFTLFSKKHFEPMLFQFFFQKKLVLRVLHVLNSILFFFSSRDPKIFSRRSGNSLSTFPKEVPRYITRMSTMFKDFSSSSEIIQIVAKNPVVLKEAQIDLKLLPKQYKCEPKIIQHPQIFFSKYSLFEVLYDLHAAAYNRAQRIFY